MEPPAEELVCEGSAGETGEKSGEVLSGTERPLAVAEAAVGEGGQSEMRRLRSVCAISAGRKVSA